MRRSPYRVVVYVIANKYKLQNVFIANYYNHIIFCQYYSSSVTGGEGGGASTVIILCTMIEPQLICYLGQLDFFSLQTSTTNIIRTVLTS